MIFQFHSMDKSVSTVTPVDSYAAISLVGSAFLIFPDRSSFSCSTFSAWFEIIRSAKYSAVGVAHSAAKTRAIKTGTKFSKTNCPKILFLCSPIESKIPISRFRPLTDRLVRMPNSKIPAVTNPTIIYPIRRFNFSTGFATISYHSLFRINW